MKTFLLALLVLFCGCAGMGSTKEITDDFTGNRIARLTYNPLAGSSLIDDAQVRFNLNKTTCEDGKTSFSVVIVYLGNTMSGWAFIPEGETLRLLVDGERVALSGTGSAGAREVQSQNVQEVAVYPISVDTLRKIANANEVRVRLEGTRRNTERHFSEANFKNVREFVDTYVQ